MLVWRRSVFGRSCGPYRTLFNMHASLTSLGEQWRVKAASVDSNDPSEDRATIVEAADGALFAVFDGHGGSACSEWCNTTMLPAAAAFITEGRSVEKALSEAAVVAETSWLEKVRAGEPHTAGACACVAHVQATAKNGLQNSTDSKRSVTVANIGDCRCVLGTVGSNGELKAIALSRDHNARMPEEQRRLILEHPGEPDVVTRADRWSSNWYVKARRVQSRRGKTRSRSLHTTIHPFRATGDFSRRYRRRQVYHYCHRWLMGQSFE